MARVVPDIGAHQRTEAALRLLCRITLAIHEAEDLDAALLAVLQGVCETTGWAFGQVWLPQADGATLGCSSVWYAASHELQHFRSISEQFVFAPGGGLPGVAWSTGQPVWSRNVTLDPTIPRGAFAQEVGLKAAVAIPVLAEQQVVTVLEFFVCAERQLDQQLIELVATVAAQLGLFIQRKHAEAALRQSESRYRAVVDTASDAIITMSADGTVQSFNRGAEHAFGYSADDVIGQQLTLLMPERFHERHLAGLRRYLATGKARLLGRTVEVAGLRKDGTEFPLELSITEVQEAQGPLFAAILRDTTRRKLTEAMLERQAATLRWQAQLLDLAHEAILVRDLQTNRILFWSQGATTMYGWTDAEALDQVSHLLLRTEFTEPLDTILATLNQTDYWAGELTHTTRDGRRIVVVSRWAIRRDDQGEQVAVLEINNDITERKQAELERAALLAAEQEHSKRLRELAALKADFTAMVAHELSSPLAAIRIFGDMLAAGTLNPEQQAQAIAAIQSETSMLTSLVDDVRASAAVESAEFVVAARPVSIRALLAPAATFAEALPGTHPVTLNLGVDVTVIADPERIGQVLRNLLSNAAKYSTDGTPIELRAALVGKRLRIDVIDQGPGIHPDDLRRIFEKFGRGRDPSGRRVAGAGLGLYLSRRIVQAHGSDLDVYSTVGIGSVFGFELEVVG